jgi:hypothetical protein
LILKNILNMIAAIIKLVLLHKLFIVVVVRFYAL